MEKQPPRSRMSIEDTTDGRLSVRLEMEDTSGGVMTFAFRPPLVPGESIGQLQRRMLQEAQTRIGSFLEQTKT